MRGEDFASTDMKRNAAWITPACAGKTTARFLKRGSLKDHPRMRGEDVQPVLQSGEIRGSPPHARGRPSFTKYTSTYLRITPACAGKTQRFLQPFSPTRDHPRMRGEDHG